MVRAFCFLLALAACAPSGEELRDWTIDGRQVLLPSNQRVGDLPEGTFTLRRKISLDGEKRGRPLTLSLDCFHGELALRVDDVPVNDIGDTAVGEHRFIIAPSKVDLRDLELVVVRDPLVLGIEVPPRLSIGPKLRPSGIAMFNRELAVIDLAVIAVFLFLFGVAFLLDRRRIADIAFAMGMVCSSVAAFAQLGLLTNLGVVGSGLIAMGVTGTNLAVLYFIHASFALGPPPRWIVRAYTVLVVLATPAALFKATTLAWSAVLMPVDLAFFGYIMRRLLELRKGPRGIDALLLAFMMVAVIGVVTPDLLGLFLGHNVLGGAHTLPFGAIGFGLAQALHLGREQVVRQRELEHTADELRRQVAERSRELAEALARLSQHPVVLDVDRVIDGRYRIVKKLGAGGMGAVYEVERLSDKQHLALKTLRGRGEPDLMARFAREAQIAAEISHPNLVPVLDVGISDGGLFLVMPLVVGGSLERTRAQFGNEAWAKPLLAQIAEGLAALHAREIVHRDLKPANILIAAGQARIADFGLAALRVDSIGETLPTGDALAETAAPGLTQRGDVFGTPAYMAPELAVGVQDPKPSSDIFSFGILAYEMLTGKAPFVEPPVVARLHGRAITVTSSAVDPIVLRCLSIDPHKRPTAAELASSF